MFVMLKWNVHEFILNLKQAENDEKHSKEFSRHDAMIQDAK